MARRDVERAAKAKGARPNYLIGLYITAEERIAGTIRSLFSRKRTAQERSQLRGMVTVELRRVKARTPDAVRELIQSVFSTGEREAQRLLRRREARPLSGVDTQASEILVQNLIRDLGNATDTVGRRVADIFRREQLRAAFEEVQTNLPEGLTSEGMARRLEREGITAFVDSAGRRWKLSTYAQMAVRTTTNSALAHATARKMADLGYDLVKVSDHHCTFHTDDPANPCRRLEGEVVSLAGLTPDYPSLVEEGLPPWHPNCTHFVLPAVESFARPEAVPA